MAEAADNDIVRSIAPTGTLRAAINYGNIVLAQKGPDGEPAGISADLARELGRRLDVPVSFTIFDTAGKVVDALNGPAAWDVAFLAIDPKRAQTIAFTAPYVIIEGAYMVPKASPLMENDQVDRPGSGSRSAEARPMTCISGAPSSRPSVSSLRPRRQPWSCFARMDWTRSPPSDSRWKSTHAITRMFASFPDGSW